MLFGKIKNTKDEWGFNDEPKMFETYKEVTEKTQYEFVLKANEEQKIIKGDKDGNPILVDIPKPTPKEERKKRITELKRFLADTDWYAIRFADTGEEIPIDIKKKRHDAREEIKRLSD